MKLVDRESIEWVNCWWSNANEKKRRCLLIGDSTIRQIRGSLEFLTTNLFAVDLLAASFSIFDGKFEKYLKVFFAGNDYSYDLIIFQYGGHHGFSRMCSESVSSANGYYNRYKKIIGYLLKKCKKLIILTSTSEVQDKNVDKIDEVIEKEIIYRNSVAQKVGKATGCKVFDLYGLMKKTNYEYADRQHFRREADGYICYELLSFLLAEEVVKQKLVKGARIINQKCLKEILIDRKIIIYGTGAQGTELYWMLKWNGLEKNIENFVITNDIREKTLFDIPVKIIDGISQERREKEILIISSKQYEVEMRQKAEMLNFKNIITREEIRERMGIINR